MKGRVYHTEYTSIKGIRKFRIEEYNYIEQNPDIDSSWAEMAREGHNIM